MRLAWVSGAGILRCMRLLQKYQKSKNTELQRTYGGLNIETDKNIK